MVLVLLSGIGVALYVLLGLVLLAWIDYDYQLFAFIAECPVPALELVLLFGWPVLLSVYSWRRRGWCVGTIKVGSRSPWQTSQPGDGVVPRWPTHR